MSSFSCTDDADIETFLHERAVEFEKLSKARTFLVVDEEQIGTCEIRELTIYGYVSLALKLLTIPEGVSNRVRKKLDGFSAKINGKPIQDFPCYLIGQLARNSNVPKESISGAQLINLACDVIARAVATVGGRYIMIECHNNEKLISFYKANEFRFLDQIPDESSLMVQMIRKIWSEV